MLALVSMIVGIRVDSENIQSGKIKHCNSSYFTMVAKDEKRNNIAVPGLILNNKDEIRRFYNCLKQIALKKERHIHEEIFDCDSPEALSQLKNHNIRIEIS